MKRRAKDYAWEKLCIAANVLMGPDPLSQRIYGASRTIQTLKDSDFEDVILREEYQEIRSLLGLDSNAQERVDQRMEGLNDDEQQMVSKAIWKLARAVIEDYARAHP